MSVLLLFAFLAFAHGACDFSGSWVVGAADYEMYTIIATNKPDVFVAACSEGQICLLCCAHRS